eukprot:3515257-Lingulodinium_polyedra.AAC.1
MVAQHQAGAAGAGAALGARVPLADGAATPPGEGAAQPGSTAPLATRGRAPVAPSRLAVAAALAGAPP